MRVWWLSENLNVNYSLGARMVAGLPGPARIWCMRIKQVDMHPAAPTADIDANLLPFGGQVNSHRNTTGLDNVIGVLQASPFVRRLPARKNELLHNCFRDDSLARRMGMPVTTWLVRYEENIRRLVRGRPAGRRWVANAQHGKPQPGSPREDRRHAPG